MSAAPMRFAFADLLGWKHAHPPQGRRGRDAVVTCRPRVDYFGGSHYGFCFPCGFYGPLRRWAWVARRDARWHTKVTGG